MPKKNQVKISVKRIRYLRSDNTVSEHYVYTINIPRSVLEAAGFIKNGELIIKNVKFDAKEKEIIIKPSQE